jgi:aminoglycoside phosphotransferase (APT) family kinase protein
VSVTLLADGVYHSNFLVRAPGVTYVARVNRESQWGLSCSAQLSREFAVLRDLESAHVAPAPIALIDVGPMPFIIESVVPGEYASHDRDLIACAQAIARAHDCAPVHSAALLDATPAKDFLLADGKALLTSCRITEANQHTLGLLTDAADLLGTVALTETEQVLLHTDLIQKNLLVDRGRCMIVDWEGARIGDRAWDLAYFLSPVTLSWAYPPANLDDEQKATFITAYARFAGVDRTELAEQIRKFTAFVIFRALSWCTAYASNSTQIAPSALDRLAVLTSPEYAADALLELLR